MADKHDVSSPHPPAPPHADTRTAQEADQSGQVPGVGPVSPAAHSPGPVETIEDQGIGPRTPYPEGNPPIPGAKPADAKSAPHKDPTR